MQKTKIDWAQYTWNPITGCLHNCPYCYARGIAQRFKRGVLGDDCTQPGNGLHEIRYKNCDTFRYGFEPTLHSYRLLEPQRMKKPAHIFTVSMGDMFGEWVPEKWIKAVFDAIEQAPQHTYTILTKNPKKAYEFLCNHYDGISQDNIIIGTSITGSLDEPEQTRLRYLSHLRETCIVSTVLSVEPMLFEINPDLLPPVDWLIIGGQTGRNPIIPPFKSIRKLLIDCFGSCTPVFVKDNCRYPDGPREYPDNVPHDKVEPKGE